MSSRAGSIGAVVEGRRGRLFLGRQDGFDLGRFTDGTALPPFLLSQWRATLSRRGAELAALGIPYVLLVAPDASSVHFEDLPDSYPGPYRTPGQAFVEAMGDIPGVTVIYPVAALRGARGGLDTYQLTDSHWTSFGSGVAYRELMHAIVGQGAQGAAVPETGVQFSFRSTFGDLGSLCDPERRCEIPVASFDGPEPKRVLERSGAQRQMATWTCMTGLQPSRVVAFRDSFMTDLAPYLARSFSDLLMLGTTTRVLLDAVLDWRADLVISQVAERRLVAFETDHQPHGYDWLYLTDHSGEVGVASLRSLNLLAGGDIKGAAAMVASLPSVSSLPPAHAYSSAVVLEAAGDYAGALPLAEAALQGRPRDPGAMALLARLLLARGDAADAVRAATRAASAAPWNGSHQELVVYALIQDGRPVDALAAAEVALKRIADHGNLWYWAGILREASGDHAGAYKAVSNALMLDPENPAYLVLQGRSKREAQT